MSSARFTRSEVLSAALEATRDDDGGEVDSSPQQIAEADPEQYGVALATTDGDLFSAGDSGAPFTIQSISKAFVYALAIAERGHERVLEVVDVEPSGEAFNEISLEEKSGRPANPMINAGALTVHSLIGGSNADFVERCDRIITMLSEAAGRQLVVDDDAYDDELGNSDRNLSIAHMLRSLDMLPDDPRDVVAGYVRQCSVLVTTEDLALMGATLANGGTHPLTGTEVFTPEVVRATVAVMTTCGMYSSAGDWTSSVGIPAKSGIAGAIMGALPGCLGITAFSPRIDRHGNSVRGQELFAILARDLDLHLLDPAHWRQPRWRTLT